MNLFFYLLLLFLPIQLGKHFWPDFSFVSGIRADYLSPTIYVTDILIFILFVGWIFRKPKFSIFNFQFLIKSKFQTFTLIALVIGVMVSKSPFTGLYGVLKLLEFIFLGFYTAGNIKRLNFGIVLLLFSIGIIFESFLSFIQYFHQGSIGGIFYWFGERAFNSQTPGIANASINGELILRPYGTFPHPNVLAGYLFIGMTLILNAIMNQKSRIKRIGLIVAISIGTVALFSTFSRVAILLWLVILGLSFERKFMSKFIVHNSYFLILVLAGLLLLGLATPLGSRLTDIRLTDESIAQRANLIKSSVAMIQSNPIFGVGLNNFLINLPKYSGASNPLFYLQPVHNIYLLVLSQTGIVGFVFFMWFIGKTYKRIMNHELGIRGKNSIIHNSKFIILSSVLILGLFDHYFLTLQQGQLLFSFILGLCWAKLSKR